MEQDVYDRRLENLPASIWEKIAQIDELKGRWAGGVRLGPQVLGRLKQSVLITSTGASTRIEGARLADEDVEKLMVSYCRVPGAILTNPSLPGWQRAHVARADQSLDAASRLCLHVLRVA